jgi:RND superfamily putative drug exporter
VRIFHALGCFAYRFRWPVLIFWAVLLVGSAFFAPDLSGRLKGGGFENKEAEAEKVQDILYEDFDASPATLTVVFEGDDGMLARSEEFREAEDLALEEVRNLDEVSEVTTYAETEDPLFVSEDGTKSYAIVSFDVSIEETQGLVDEVRERVRSEELDTYVTGAPAVYLDITEASNEDIKRAEKYAFPLALVILLVAFGSLVAAGVPVVIGGASVAVTLSSLYFLAGVYDMSVFVLTISTMLGLGLGIDYALFAVSRFREELVNHAVSEAVPRTVETAGRSIFFSGTAVLIGLMGLLFFPYMFMRSIGVAGVVVVFFSVSAALTLLPAVLSVLGHNINALSLRRRRDMARPFASGFWNRSAQAVMRHPFVVIVAVGACPLLPPVPRAAHEGGHPRGDRTAARVRVPPGRRHPQGGLRLPPSDPDGDRRHRPRRPPESRGLTEVRDLGERISETEGVGQRREHLYRRRGGRSRVRRTRGGGPKRGRSRGRPTG